MDKIKVGDCFITNEGYKIIVKEYESFSKIKINFVDYGYCVIVQGGGIRSGSIKNLYHKSVEGIGYIGVGIYKSKFRNKSIKSYKHWSAMFLRCYNDKELLKYPTYKDCSVAPEWHNFQNFAKWFEENYIEGYQLDKDILVKGNKIYSPETCCFVPARINSLLINCKSKRGVLPIGVCVNGSKYISKIGKIYIGTFDTPEEAFNAYKDYKERVIKSIAREYFKDDLISEKVYSSIANWSININD